MSEHHNRNYSREEIKKALAIIQDCIREDRFIMSKNKNRQENIDFINDYNLNSKKQKKILLDIEIEDFCYSLQNTNIGYEQEVLYVFCPQVKLFNFDGIEELIDIYIKFNLIDKNNGKLTIVISFHKRNKPISYLFR